MEDAVLTAKERRIQRKLAKAKSKMYNPGNQIQLNLQQIKPLTQNQKLAFNSYHNNKNLLLHGSAGTGKTFLSFYLALNDILSDGSTLKKLYVVRSTEPSKNVGFLPGSLKEKVRVLEAPYIAICTELFGRGDAYEYLKSKGVVEFISTAYIRGITLDNCIILVDEAQNLEWNELLAIVTRAGENTRIIFCGDYIQSDLKNNYQGCDRKNDILRFMDVIRQMKTFNSIEFTYEDILRSKLVKEFIMISARLGYL